VLRVTENVVVPLGVKSGRNLQVRLASFSTELSIQPTADNVLKVGQVDLLRERQGAWLKRFDHRRGVGGARAHERTNRILEESDLGASAISGIESPPECFGLVEKRQESRARQAMFGRDLDLAQIELR